MNAMTIKPVEVAAAFEPNPVMTAGSGAPVVYFHGVFGPEWNGLLDDLSEKQRVFAPATVGADEPDELRSIDGILDLVLYYDTLFDRLGLDKVDLVGHSFGGMAAAEYAAVFPHRVGKLVLIDALGLWRDDAPVGDHLYQTPAGQQALMYADPAQAEVVAANAPPQDADAKMAAAVRRMTATAASALFLWPIPDRGLRKRLSRIKAPTLILWGEQDRFAPPVYAQDFAAGIAGAKVQIIPGAGHTPQVERRAETSKAVLAFLGATA
jgi:pimeloyl-ACP methyl ester carboxylesterase